MPRREKNIYKRNDGRYEARYIKGRDENGKAIYGAVYARTYAEVKEKRDRAKPPDKASEIAKERRTVTEELEAYLYAMRNQIKPSTYGIYRRYIGNYISPYFGNTRCDRLTAEMAQEFVDKQLENGLSAVTAMSLS